MSTTENLPWLLRRLLELAAVDSAGASALEREGLVTLADLEAALLGLDGRHGLDDRRAIQLPAPHDNGIRLAAASLTTERPLMALGRAVDLLDGLMLLASAVCPALDNLTAAGDVRRFEPVVESLVIAASAPDPPEALDAICALPVISCVLHRTSRRALVEYKRAEVDVRIATPDAFGTMLHAATGSGAHVAGTRARQRTARLYAREEDVYLEAGLVWIPPELRHDIGEIEAAAEGRLPSLVERGHIRGDLHMHSDYSDGRDSLADMVQAAAAIGHEYIAITDHSERSFASRTLSIDRLARQREEVASLRERFPDLVILHGIEVDIMPDGGLDFPDAVLEPLDIVLASLHDPAGHDRARLTARCLRAIHHPLVNVITHPANRMVGRDTGHDLDFPAVYEAAAATGTALEIDGAPGHLDMDGEHARAAVSAGVTVTIDSDCHHARLLDRQMRLGVGTARRGWVEPRHVLNTRPVSQVLAFVAAKRRSVR